ncbi:tetratricopeptide repeat protein [Chroococcidiopsis sp. TS-821]|uniref:tetratricopeptide repeat protein n=1 Tax=Chroococcidiopsis sp. TS-821 TaxID=1378066 RepID=UPI00143DA333|nr:tetratricopeptide repeat protein [Chroococcidiopsis sp. TS-821]
MKSLNKKYHWLETIEGFAIIGSVGGAIASVISQQAILASLPLSAALVLNWANRKFLIASIEQNQQAITHVLEQNAIPQERFASISSQVAQLQQANVSFSRNLNENNTTFNQLRQESSNLENKVEQLAQQIAELKNEISFSSHLEPQQKATPEEIQNFSKEYIKLAETINYLREIERCHQNIQLNPNSATAYYERAQTYEQLGEKRAAIADYTQAIRLDANYTEAYYKRGLNYSSLANKKQAIKDFRTAAKLFFAKGDIENYTKAKSLSQKLHQLETQNEVVNSIPAGQLFATAVN